MYRINLFLTMLFICGMAFATEIYQVDLILFAQPQNTDEFQDLQIPLLPVDKKAFFLDRSTQKTDKLYTLLPPSQSNLRDQYYLLNRKSQYSVLAQYSWRQKAKEEKNIALHKMNNKGWLMQGVLQVKKGNAYSFHTDLQFSPPSNPSAAFTVVQNQRLDEEVIYYLDHPYIGMIVKIHPVN